MLLVLVMNLEALNNYVSWLHGNKDHDYLMNIEVQSNPINVHLST